MPSSFSRPPRHRARRGRSSGRSLLVVLVALTGVGGLGLGVGAGGAGQAGAPARASSTATTQLVEPVETGAVAPAPPNGHLDPAPEVRAAAVLSDWDRARAAAWRDGDARALNALYVGDAGAHDVALLRRYADRGYRVRGLRTQLLSLEVLRQERDAWWLRVTDRLAGGVAVRGPERVVLPRDHADTHRLLLLRGGDGRWRMAASRPA